MHTNAKDLTGRRFGRLVAISTESSNKQGNRLWLCQCDCGRQVVVASNNLSCGQTQSCGCRKLDISTNRLTRHGLLRTAEYRAWHHAKQRCGNPRDKQYDDYGGRGIRMCDRWRGDFVAFIAEMGMKPSPAHSIDRIDNMQHYSCGNCPQCIAQGWLLNCRWATPQQQAHNRRPRRRKRKLLA